MLTNACLRPICISKGVLQAERNLFVSPQHGILLGATGDTLARAVHLAAATPGIRYAWGKSKITYIHLLFDDHQIIFGNDVPSESFFPGRTGLSMMNHAARSELFDLFPDLETVEAQIAYGPQARPFTPTSQLQSSSRKMRAALP